MSNALKKGVIFDLDGTLYVLSRRKARVAAALIKDVKILRHLGGTRAWIRGQSFADRASLREAFFLELGRRARLSKEQAAEWYEDRFLSTFNEILKNKAETRPGLLPLLARLRQKKVKLAVVSDYGWVKERLLALRIPLELFDDLCASEDYGVLKPSPRPLLELAEKWGVAPESIIVVGDRDDMDGASARAAGMMFLGVADKMVFRSAKTGFVSWEEAQGLLDDRTVN